MAFQNFFAAKLFTDIGSSDTTITLDTAPTATSGRMVLEARNPTQREVIKYTGVSGTQLTGVLRGQGGTTAKSHLKNALIEMNLTSEDIQDIYDTFTAFVGTYPLKNFFDNAIINAGCMVAQRTAPNLSTTYQYGQVDRFAACGTGTAVSAGTISQTTTPSVVSQGYALKLAGVTITGTGKVFIRYRMEAKDALKLKNQSISFGVTVRHDVGSNINYSIILNKPTVADNFASVTNIVTSGTTSVGTATNVQVKIQNQALGDVSNGLEIIVQADCGAVTTKNFEFGEFILNKAAVLSTYQPVVYQQELQACLRYYYAPSLSNPGIYVSGLGSAYVGGGASWIAVSLATPLRATPTVTAANLGVRYGGADFAMSGVVVANLNAGWINLNGATPGTGNGNSGSGWISPNGTLVFDAEL